MTKINRGGRKAEPGKGGGAWSAEEKIAGETNKPRTHDAFVTRRLPNGRADRRPQPFTFQPHTPLAVSREVAMQFAPLDFFIVRTPDGARVRPVTHKSSGGTFNLEPGQIVANLEELTLDALKERARSLPGFDNLPRDANKDRLMSFVISGGLKPEDLWDEDEDLEVEDEVAVLMDEDESVVDAGGDPVREDDAA